MGETFYSALGVDANADREAIQRAYRDHVKETHPDVSDSPDAAERFKRLTTARDVLVDEQERRRYDRLGHDSYVEQHAGNSAWTDDTGTAGRATPPTGSANGVTTNGERAGTGGAASSSRTGARRAAGRRRSRQERQQSASSGGRSRTGGGYGTSGWQAASEAYTRTPMDVDGGRGSIPSRLFGAARSLGPWLLVDLVLICSAVATGWFLYATSVHLQGSVAALIGGLLLVVLVIGLSLVHMLAELYS